MVKAKPGGPGNDYKKLKDKSAELSAKHDCKVEVFGLMPGHDGREEQPGSERAPTRPAGAAGAKDPGAAAIPDRAPAPYSSVGPRAARAAQSRDAGDSEGDSDDEGLPPLVDDQSAGGRQGSGPYLPPRAKTLSDQDPYSSEDEAGGAQPTAAQAAEQALSRNAAAAEKRREAAGLAGLAKGFLSGGGRGAA